MEFGDENWGRLNCEPIEITTSEDQAGIDTASPQAMIKKRLTEAAQIAHLEFMKTGEEAHGDDGWWCQLNLEIEEIINSYL